MSERDDHALTLAALDLSLSSLCSSVGEVAGLGLWRASLLRNDEPSFSTTPSSELARRIVFCREF